MHRVPFFIEVLHSPQSAPLQICRKVMASLFKQRIAPLPFASSVEEVRDVLAALKTKGMEPAVFVVNTYWAEEVLAALDPYLGQTPVLFFVREMAGDLGGGTEGHDRISDTLSKMSLRSSSVWTFGSQNAESTAQKAAVGIAGLLRDGSFYHIERHSPLQASLLQMINSVETGSPTLAPTPSSATIKVPVNKISNVEIPCPQNMAAAAGKKMGVHGSLKQIGLSSLLMMLDMEKKSGELVIARTRESVRLLLRKGRVIRGHADNSSASGLDGAEAVYFALSWTEGDFDFSPRDIDLADEINAQTTQLLMEGARRMDTSAAAM